MFPQALAPIFQNADITIRSPRLSPQYLIRMPSLYWWTTMERIFEDAEVGCRILVRRDVVPQDGDDPIHVDYLTTRVSYETIYGHWVHHMVAYYSTENCPYGFDVDAYHTRGTLISNDYNNHRGRVPPAPPALEPAFRPALPALEPVPHPFRNLHRLPPAPAPAPAFPTLPASFLALPAFPAYSVPPIQQVQPVQPVVETYSSPPPPPRPSVPNAPYVIRRPGVMGFRQPPIVEAMYELRLSEPESEPESELSSRMLHTH